MALYSLRVLGQMANIRGQWVGDNWLGKLWMELRDKLKNV